MEIRYCGEGDQWSARAQMPDGALQVEAGRSKDEAIGKLFAHLAPSMNVLFVENPSKPGVIVTHEGQALLVAVGKSLIPHYGASFSRRFRVLMGVDGDRVREECTIGYSVAEHVLGEIGTDELNSGLWVWEGKIEVEDPGFLDRTTWVGGWRPAEIADFGRFDVAISSVNLGTDSLNPP